eukprot:scaffold154271_cov37-Prasinocladus_malaysianus.AAC.1
MLLPQQAVQHEVCRGRPPGGHPDHPWRGRHGDAALQPRPVLPKPLLRGAHAMDWRRHHVRLAGATGPAPNAPPHADPQLLKFTLALTYMAKYV